MFFPPFCNALYYSAWPFGVLDSWYREFGACAVAGFWLDKVVGGKCLCVLSLSVYPVFFFPLAALRRCTVRYYTLCRTVKYSMVLVRLEFIIPAVGYY